MLGIPASAQQPRYVTNILKSPDFAWLTQVQVPQQSALYGSASDQTLPVVSLLIYPVTKQQSYNGYVFPYHDSAYDVFESMLGMDESSVDANGLYEHAGFIRPLVTQTLSDSILDSETFGPHIGLNNVRISVHSFGGFTTLAGAGGDIRGQGDSVIDPRFTAAVFAALWGGYFEKSKKVFALASITQV